MNTEELVKIIIALMQNMEVDLLKSHKVRSAAQKARVKTVKLAKLMKKFREISPSIVKKK